VVVTPPPSSLIAALPTPAAPLPTLEGNVVVGPVRILRPRPGEIVPGDGLLRLRATTALPDLRSVDVAITAGGRLLRLVRVPVEHAVIASWIRIDPPGAPRAIRLSLRGTSKASPLAEVPLIQEGVQPLRITNPWLPGGTLEPGSLLVSGRVAAGISEVSVRLERPRGRFITGAMARASMDLTTLPVRYFFIAGLRVPSELRPGMYWIVASAEEGSSGRSVSDVMSVVVRSGG
jgi:hypothetical protein